MPTMETTGTERHGEVIGQVKAERVAEGMRLSLFCPSWAACVERGDVHSERYNVCRDTTPRKLYRVPDGVSLSARESRGIYQDGNVNLLPLLAEGLGREGGAVFTFPGVFTAEAIKNVADAFKRFLVNHYREYARPVTVNYTIVADSE